MTSTLTAVLTPADSSAVEVLMPRLRAALGGGAAILPVPAGDAGVRASLLAALRPDDPAAPLEADDVAVVLATSGSSGMAKGVLLRVDAMRWAADALHELVGGPGTWLLALPAWHVGGLQVITRSLHAGTVPVAMDLTRTFTAEAFVQATSEVRARAAGGPTYASIVPTQLSRLLDGGTDGVAALASYDAVLVGAAATPPAAVERATSAGCRILLSYGMSETTGGCCYDGRPLAGVEVRVRTTDGRILIRGPTLFSGYRLRPELTAGSLVDGWLVTPDLGRLDDAGGLQVLGRTDDVVVTGGENVSPLAVIDALRSADSVADAEVLGVPDDEWGQAVVAFVVAADPGAPVDVEALRTRVGATLGRAAVPRRVVVVDALPMLPSGKVDRAALLASMTGAGLASGRDRAREQV